MKKSILQLMEDHHRLAQLLILLDKQMRALDTDADFDSQLTLGILDYVKHQPDVFHHPLEELIFERVRRRSAELRPVIEKLKEEHLQLARQTRECQKRFVLWSREGELSDRAKASELGKAYVDFQRRHMALEEREFFPHVPEILSESDWKEINNYASVAAPIADPLFGPTTVERYRNIRNSIQEGLG